MKDPGKRRRHRSAEVVAKLREADEALVKGNPIADVARSLGVPAVTFETPAEAKYLVDRWRLHYNHRRPQRALGKRTPAACAATFPALPPLRLAALACAASPPGTGEATSMLTLSQGVDR